MTGFGSGLRTPARSWTNALRAFTPHRVAPGDATAAPATIVQITSALPSDFDLVLTFSGSVRDAAGTARVAALQDVSAQIRMDLGHDATLFWMASVLTRGSPAPNQASYPYTSETDTFNLSLSQGIALNHDARGWNIPNYDDRTHSLVVGFGLAIAGWAYWAYAVPCRSRRPQLVVLPGSYVLLRSNGSEQLGDPVDTTQERWSVPMGGTYSLSFDATGKGSLRRLDGREPRRR
jgi:hypothetical protein